MQMSEEVDLKLVNAIRNVMFGPPGAGGTDLAAVDIQRGRDHGLPDYNTLRDAYGLSTLTQLARSPRHVALRQALSATLRRQHQQHRRVRRRPGGGPRARGRAWGRCSTAIIKDQFERTRDGDRLFYRGNAAGLYTNGVLQPVDRVDRESQHGDAGRHHRGEHGADGPGGRRVLCAAGRRRFQSRRLRELRSTSMRGERVLAPAG